MSFIIPIEILVWKPEYSIYLPDLDQKTRRAYQIVNDFHGAMLAGKGKETLIKVLPVHALFGPDYTNHHRRFDECNRLPGPPAASGRTSAAKTKNGGVFQTL